LRRDLDGTGGLDLGIGETGQVGGVERESSGLKRDRLAAGVLQLHTQVDRRGDSLVRVRPAQAEHRDQGVKGGSLPHVGLDVRRARFVDVAVVVGRAAARTH
jgi:hypothetical protein